MQPLCSRCGRRLFRLVHLDARCARCRRRHRHAFMGATVALALSLGLFGRAVAQAVPPSAFHASFELPRLTEPEPPPKTKPYCTFGRNRWQNGLY